MLDMNVFKVNFHSLFISIGREWKSKFYTFRKSLEVACGNGLSLFSITYLSVWKDINKYNKINTFRRCVVDHTSTLLATKLNFAPLVRRKLKWKRIDWECRRLEIVENRKCSKVLILKGYSIFKFIGYYDKETQ